MSRFNRSALDTQLGAATPDITGQLDNSAVTTSSEVLGSLHSYLIADGRTRGRRKSPKLLNLAYRHIEQLDAELYALQDQIAGLQELMAAQRAPESLDTAVRYLVGAADSQSDNATTGSPHHGHRIPGRWDGDSVNPKGALCEEYAAWDILRQYVATDIVAEAQVIEDARVTQLQTILAKFVEHHDTHQQELTEDQKVDQDFLWFEAVAEARAAITQPVTAGESQ